MSGQRILITGDTGFVGKALVSRIRALNNVGSGKTIEAVSLIDPASGQLADLTDAEATDRAVAAAKPDAIIHLAAIAAPREAHKSPVIAWNVNLTGTFNLAEAVRRHAGSARLVCASTSEVYGLSFNKVAGPIGEDVPLQPTTVYGATKAAADIMLAQMARDGLNIVRLRPFNHTGVGQQPGYVVPDFARQIALIEAGTQPAKMRVGNLEAQRDFLSIEDVLDAYLTTAIGEDSKAGGVYNISRGSPIAIRDILDMLLGQTEVDIAVEIDPALSGPSTIPVASGSFERALEDFGWQPKIPFEQTLKDVLNHWRTAPL